MITTAISVFLMKLADCSLSTLKTVFLVKNKFFTSSIMNSLAAMLFIFVADSMANAPSDQKWLIAVAVFFANLMGGYLPPMVIDRFSKDRLFVYVITAPNMPEGKSLADSLRLLEIPVSTTVIYGKDLRKTLSVKAYAETKQNSRKIENFLTSDFKWHLVEAI